MKFYVTPLTVLAYLLPIALLLVVRSSRTRPAWEIALDIPLAAGLDLLLILALARMMRVETAVLASRPIWLLAAAAVVVLRRRRGERLGWPRVLGRREVAAIAVAAAAAVGLSLTMSRPFMMWDREWHITLSSSLRGQTIPFHNIFEAGQELHYHITGNVLAAELQVLSGNVLNASFGLSLAHDIFFGLTATTIGLALVHFAPAQPATLVAGSLAVLLVGPFTLRGGVGDDSLGYNFHNFLSLSFRPHVPIAGLMLVAVYVAVLARIERSTRPPPAVGATLFPLLASIAVLGITDESATALVGIGLFCAWLIEPNVIVPERSRGLAAFAGMAVAFIGPNLAFSAALAPGGPLQHMALVPWRNPGFANASIPLSQAGALNVLVCDVLPFTLCLLGLAAYAVRKRSRPHFALLAFAAVIGCVAVIVLTRVEINERADNVQRFMVAPMFVLPLAGLLCLDRSERGSFASALIVLGLGSGAFSSLLWLRERVPTHSPPAAMYNAPDYSLYEVDCRRAAGAHFGERAAITYVEASHYYLYAGCRPVYLPGSARFWGILMYPEMSLAGFAQVDKEAGDGPVRVVCAAHGGAGAVCPKIQDKSQCLPDGEAFVSCPLMPAERAKILGHP